MILRYPWGKQQPSLGVRQNLAHPLSRGLVGHWLINEGGGLIAYDMSENRNHGVLTNGPTWTTGNFGSAVNFDGANDYITVADVPSIQITGNMSLSVWAYFTSFNGTNDQVLFSKRVSGVGWEIVKTNDFLAPGIAIVIYEGTRNVIRYNTITLILNTWYHFSAVYNAQAQTLDWFHNGSLDNGSLVGPPVPTVQIDAATPLILGAAAAGSYFTGKISDARIYNRALSAAEIAQLYAAPYADMQMAHRILARPGVAASDILMAQSAF